MIIPAEDQVAENQRQECRTTRLWFRVGALKKWMNASEVKVALHVDANAFFFSGDNGAGFVYNLTEPNLSEFYKHVALNTSLRVLIYNGDTDPGLNT